MIPEELRYTSDHEWVRDLGDGRLRVGVTDYAQGQLGDVVFVQLPTVGEQLGAGDTFGEVESTKSVSDVYAPVSGEVLAVNESLADRPELINSDPYGEGWLVELRASDGGAADFDSLLTAEKYAGLTEQS